MRPKAVGIFVGACAAWLLGGFFGANRSEDPERRFADLPVLNGGRIKPLDSVARNALLVMSGRQSVRVQGRRLGPEAWLLDMSFRAALADAYPVFEINDPDVQGLMGVAGSDRRRFSFRDLHPRLAELQTQAARAEGVRAEQRTRFHAGALRLWGSVATYWRIQNTLQAAGAEDSEAELRAFGAALAPGDRAAAHADPGILSAFLSRYQELSASSEYLPLPPLPGAAGDSAESWTSVGGSLLARARGEPRHPGVEAFARIADAYRSADRTAFAAAVEAWRKDLSGEAPRELVSARREAVFNRFQPFYRSLQLYLLAALLLFVSFLRWPEGLRRSASGLLVLAFAVHTGGLFARVVLQGRPPVTNLYSSAVFVGWCAVFLGVLLERVHRTGFSALGAAVVGFLTLIIAHHLAQQGDTMEMMRAVLDSNFWLATHVVTVTVGYGAGFLAGSLGIVHIVGERLTRRWTQASSDALARMVYGVVCFSLFFSFVGTVLGGIWADQSWGRFWGWDPKENGALMIVLWNALILHLRWAKRLGTRGLMVAAVAGNIVTALSWFGVNMLGIGLHSYGFMDKAFPWLALFVLSQAGIISFALVTPAKPPTTT